MALRTTKIVKGMGAPALYLYIMQLYSDGLILMNLVLFLGVESILGVQYLDGSMYSQGQRVLSVEVSSFLSVEVSSFHY